MKNVSRSNASWYFVVKRAATLIFALGFFGSSAVAQLPVVGGETRAHAATTTDFEQQASVAMRQDGSFIIAHVQLDGSTHGVIIRQFDKKGVPLGSPIQPYTNTAPVQAQPAVAVADNGNFVVVYEDDGRGLNDVYFALYNTAGTKLTGPTRVNTIITGVRENPRVAMNPTTGDFAVVFAGGANSNSVSAYLRRYNASGTPTDAAEIKVNTSTNNQAFAPSVGYSDTGNIVVAWEDDPDGDVNFTAMFQRYGATGPAVGSNTPASQAGHDTTEVEVACSSGGSFALGWVDGLPANQSDPKDLLYRTYLSNGTPVTGISTFKTGAFSANGVNLVPRIRIAARANSEFLYTWVHNDEIYGRFFSLNGPKAAEFQVNTTSNSNSGEFQANPWAAYSPEGSRAVIVWDGTGVGDDRGVFFQRFAVPNVAPVLGAIGAKSGAELSALTFQATATDANYATVLGYSLENAPSGASINASTGQFTWTPTEAQGPGSYQVTVKVTDDGEPATASDSEIVTINVTESNSPPSQPTLSNLTLSENVAAGTVVGTVNSTDADVPAQTITFSVGGTDGSKFSMDGSSLKIMESPDYETKSSYSIEITATDSASGSSSQAYTITIQNLDEVAPTSTAGMTDPTVAGTNQVVVKFVASDAEGSVANTRLYVKTPGQTTFADSGISPVAGNSGSFSYTAATDGIYGFFTKATDVAGNVQPDAGTAQVNATVNLDANSSMTLTASAAAQSLVFPMTQTRDVIITLSGATPGGTLTVSRTAPLSSTPAYFQHPEYLLNEKLTIESTLASGFTANLNWQYDTANLTAPATITEVTQFDGGETPTATFPATATGSSITVEGITSFSDWYAGSSVAVPVTLSGFSIE